MQPERLPWHTWGGVLWRFSGNAFLHPFEPHPRGSANYVVFIRLRRNDENPYLELTGTRETDFIGDSELDLRVQGAATFRHPGAPPDMPPTVGMLVPNNYGRAGAMRLETFGAVRMLDAYRAAQTAFNLVAVDVARRHSIPLRRSAVLITRIEAGNHEFAIVAPIGYPNAPGIISFDHPLPMARLNANYAEALASNSPFYAFLCLFSLVEFLIGPLQGRLRHLNLTVPISFENLNGTLSGDEVRHIGHFIAGMSFAQLLERARDQRNAVAHFLIERSPRPFEVVAEDQVAFQRDVLKIAAKRLLEIAERNARRFLAAGVAEYALTTVFEGRFRELCGLVRVLEQRVRTLPQL